MRHQGGNLALVVIVHFKFYIKVLAGFIAPPIEVSLVILIDYAYVLMPLFEYLSALLLSISLLFLDLQKKLLDLPMVLLSQILKFQPRCRVKAIFPDLFGFFHFGLILHLWVCLGRCVCDFSSEDGASGNSFCVKHPEFICRGASYRELLGGFGWGCWELHVVSLESAGAARSIPIGNKRYRVRRRAWYVHEDILAWAGSWLSEKHRFLCVNVILLELINSTKKKVLNYLLTIF